MGQDVGEDLILNHQDLGLGLDRDPQKSTDANLSPCTADENYFQFDIADEQAFHSFVCQQHQAQHMQWMLATEQCTSDDILAQQHASASTKKLDDDFDLKLIEDDNSADILQGTEENVANFPTDDDKPVSIEDIIEGNMGSFDNFPTTFSNSHLV